MSTDVTADKADLGNGASGKVDHLTMASARGGRSAGQRCREDRMPPGSRSRTA